MNHISEVLKPKYRRQLLKTIIGDVLEIVPDRVDLANSFIRLGGSSLTAVMVLARIRRLGGKGLKVADILSAKTSYDLVPFIPTSPAPPRPESVIMLPGPGESFKLSAAQRMVFLEQLKNPNTTAYNIPICCELPFILEKESLQAVIDQLVVKYEVLRHAIGYANGDLVQTLHADARSKVETYAYPDEARSGFVRPFDFNRPPLLRAAMVPLGDSSTLVIIDIHHIVADGVSLGLLLDDLRRLLAGDSIASEGVKFNAYLRWTDQPAYEEQYRQAETFWQNLLKPLPPKAIWPADRIDRDVQRYDLIRFIIGVPVTDGVRMLAEKLQTTPFNVVLLAFAIVQAELTGNWHSLAGVVSAGRVGHDFFDCFGMFANTLCFPLKMNKTDPIDEVIKNLSQTSLAASAHQSFPILDLVRLLAFDTTEEEHPLFDILFAYQNITYQQHDFWGSRFRSYFEGKQNTQFKMVLHVFEVNNELDIQWEFDPKYFRRDTVRAFATHFEQVLAALAGAKAGDSLSLLCQFSKHRKTTPQFQPVAFSFEP